MRIERESNYSNFSHVFVVEDNKLFVLEEIITLNFFHEFCLFVQIVTGDVLLWYFWFFYWHNFLFALAVLGEVLEAMEREGPKVPQGVRHDLGVALFEERLVETFYLGHMWIIILIKWMWIWDLFLDFFYIWGWGWRYFWLCFLICLFWLCFGYFLFGIFCLSFFFESRIVILLIYVMFLFFIAFLIFVCC